MKIKGYYAIFLKIVIVPLLLGMLSPIMMSYAGRKKTIQVEYFPCLEIHEGYVSDKEEVVIVKSGKKCIAKIKLSKPVIVAQAEQDEPWGYYQFPNVGISKDGTLIVGWQMASDSYNSYGKKPERPYSPKMSKNGGSTWVDQDKGYKIFSRGCNVKLNEGELLEVITPAVKDILSYREFPKAVLKKGNYSYYKEENLPQDLRGVYFRYTDNNHTKDIHSRLKDPGLLRYAINGNIPVVWWGNIKQQSDSSLVAGVYPCYYLDSNKQELLSCVSFYRSTDKGYTWDKISDISFVPDGIGEKYGDVFFQEPAFEILEDGTYLCIMRTGSYSPMYMTISKDKGNTWSNPKPITPNGVKPKLMKLENGVLVLTSGRPGIQIRFCVDGSGLRWTEPIDMIPYSEKNRLYDKDVTCGYTSVLEAGENSFYIVYSDFTKKNRRDERRKTICFRKVKVIKY